MKSIIFLFAFVYTNTADLLEDYFAKRESLISEENENFLGSELDLNQYEKFFNDQLMLHKQSELKSSFDSADFPPSKDFYLVKKQIEESMVFNRIRVLPKGGVMHVHDFGMTSSEYIVKNITYRSS